MTSGLLGTLATILTRFSFARPEIVGLGVERVCSSVGRIVLRERDMASDSPEGAGTEIAGNSWSHPQTTDASEAVVGIAENPGASVGFGGGETVGGNTAVLVGLEETMAGRAGIAKQAGVQGHGERKVVAGKQLVVGIASTVVREPSSAEPQLNCWGDT